ncbi:MAG: N-acetyl-gamma-glutamyl-phosphate reductase [Verrucomicrobiales bacterium]|nr:N-acetyl-gamma-glutamyl-phosphate reductase [Verrucomicrobiales bacterium]
MSDQKIKVVVVGASGYTGQELLRFLIMHPGVELVAVTSRAEKGRLLTDVFPRFVGSPAVEGLKFVEPDIEQLAQTGAKYAFLALPHGVASEYAVPLLDKGFRVIDLSADFRLNSPEVYEEFYGEPHPAPQLLTEAVYGLVESKRDEIPGARLVASPGCYPTSVLTPLLPLVRKGIIKPESITVASMSGTSGAGKKAAVPFLFVEVNESIRAYGAPKHRHLSEIEQELSLAAGKEVKISFVPHLMPVTAGIATTIFAELTGDPASISKIYKEAYGDCTFVRILGEGSFADTKYVVRTNFVDIGWVIDERTNRLIISSAEDNLGKGAGSQAIQCFNLMNGLPETAGLLLF